MKKIILQSVLVISFTFFAAGAFAQVPPPPGDHGQSGNQPAGNAPIGSGLFILLGLGAAYGGRKIYKAKENSK